MPTEKHLVIFPKLEPGDIVVARREHDLPLGEAFTVAQVEDLEWFDPDDNLVCEQLVRLLEVEGKFHSRQFFCGPKVTIPIYALLLILQRYAPKLGIQAQ
ncbi:hypothetical protein ACFL06_02095 [Patescibacteria group bacterium]